MNIYRYGYVWRHQGLIIMQERQHLSHSELAVVAQCEVQRQRPLLGLPSTAVACILWRQDEKDSQLTARQG